MEVDSAGDGFRREYGCFRLRSIQPEHEQFDECSKQSDKQPGSYAADATKRAHEGPATVLLDTKVTAKAKTALHEESATEHSDIYVHTTAGVFGMPLEVFDNE